MNQAPDVRSVQTLLTEIARKSGRRDYDPRGIDGLIHRNGSRSGTVRAIGAFQVGSVGLRRADNRVDVGGRTWRKLTEMAGDTASSPPPAPARPANASVFANALATIAEGEVGTMEAATNNTGADILKYKKATWLEPGAWAWCAAFVCWCYQEALSLHPIQGLNRPRTAGAWDYERWARQQSKVDLHKPASIVRKGDIVCFTFSHIGIAIADESGGYVETVEGNTNVRGERDGGGRTRDGVYRKTRSKGQIRSAIRTLG